MTVHPTSGHISEQSTRQPRKVKDLPNDWECRNGEGKSPYKAVAARLGGTGGVLYNKREGSFDMKTGSPNGDG